ncbi:hypothetical protein ACLB2K_059114 [Fragaria x ananassa]
MDSLSVFIHSIMKLENIFKETPQQALTQGFFQNLAIDFSCQPSRLGKSDITQQQVEGWFQSRRKEIQAKGTTSSGAFDWVVESHEDLSDLTMFSNEPDNSRTPKDPCVTDLSELAFEAKSSKDGAWYDVASFLTYRVVSSGELEVRVRYAEFGREEDEWVNVRRAVRDRSIPLEESECHKVKVGDLVLCFQEREDEAVYCDAHVVESRGTYTTKQAAGVFLLFVLTMIKARNKFCWKGYVAGLQNTLLQPLLNPIRTSNVSWRTNLSQR